MSFLTDAEIKEQYGPTRAEVNSWLKTKRLPNTRANRALANRKITAAKIKKTIGKSVTVLESAGAWQIVYGQVLAGGVFSFAEDSNEHRYLHMVITVAGHEINSIEKLYLDGQEVTFGASPDPRWSVSITDLKTNTTRAADHKVFMEVNEGTAGNPAIADLIGTLPARWDSNRRQSGRAHVYIIIEWDALLFPNGRPEVSFLIKGKKCFDPRTGTTAWTQNPALQVMDYLTNDSFGLGIPIAEIETVEGKPGSFWDAANVCDEDVTLNSGGTEKRYTGNGFFEVGPDHQSILEEMCTAFAGSITYSNGKWKCWPAKYREPELELTESDVVSDLRVTTRISRKDNFNAVKGTFVSPNSNYEEADFPAVRNSFYTAQDNGEEIFEDIQLPFTQSSATAQRIAKIWLERIRQPITVELVAKMRALQVETGETLKLSWERFGWIEKVFEVDEQEVIWQADGDSMTVGVRMVLRETASGVYDWNAGQETRFDLAPNTTLPSPFDVATPSGVSITSGTTELLARSDGTILSRMKVAWSPMTDFYVTSGGTIEVQYKRSVDSSYSVATPVQGDMDFCHIIDVEDSIQYDVRVRARSGFGYYSEWTTTVTHTVVGKTEKPSNVQGFAAQILGFGIFFSWEHIPDLDRKEYEIRLGDLNDSWDDSISIAVVSGNSKTVDLVLTGDYRFFIKAVDTSNNYSETAAELTLNVEGPSKPTVTFEFSGPNLSLTWTASTGLFEVRDYEIRFGNTFSSATVETTIKGTSYARKIDWSGNRRYWVVGRDVAGNYGTEASVDVRVEPPGIVDSLQVEVIDNNVLLRWLAPSSGTLPIAKFNVSKGALYDSATLVGEVGGTFAALFEIISGSYTYWVTAEDSAGNVGPERAITAFVDEPPDFVLLDDQTLDVSNSTGVVGMNYFVENGELFLCVNATQTFEEHFISNGWTSPQDQIDDGFDYYLQPSADFGYWEKTLDLGATIDAALIKFSFTQQDFGGSNTFDIFISYSADGVTYTEVEGSQVYATAFQYVKVKITQGTIPGDSGSLMGVSGLTYP